MCNISTRHHRETACARKRLKRAKFRIYHNNSLEDACPKFSLLSLL